MILKRNRILYTCIRIVIVSLFFQVVDAQDKIDLDKLISKYPDYSVVIGSRRTDINIELSDGKPLILSNEIKEYVALTDNASNYAESKEYFGGVLKIKEIEAYSMVPDKGGFKKISVKNFNKTAETGSYSFYDDLSAYTYTFPSVVKGTRMISKLNTSSDEPILPMRFYFGNFFPCEEMIFRITCPSNVGIIYKIFGNDTSVVQFSMEEKSGKKIYTWHASNKNSYRRDEIAPDIDYFTPHIVAQIAYYDIKGIRTNVIGSLSDLYKWNYSKISKINLSDSPKIKTLTDSICLNKVSGYEKASNIYRWVQRNIKYVAIEDGENGYVPREAELVLQRRYGDCKDKTSLLVTMLKSQGLKASYAWIGTRDIPYRYSEFPTDLNDNHMIAVWWDENNKPIILDGTTRFHTINDVPTSIQGKECLIEKGPDDYFLHTIPIDAAKKNTSYDSLHIILKGDTLMGSGFCQLSGENRADMLYYFEDEDNDKLPKIVSQQMPKASNKFMIESVNPLIASDSDAPFSFSYQFSLPDYSTINNKITYLNLNLDRFPLPVNIREDRWIPAELKQTQQHIFVCTFQIPEGFEVRNLPKDSFYENPSFGFHQQYRLHDQEISIKTTVNLNSLLIEGEALANLREMLRQLNSVYLKSIPIYKTEAL